MIKSLSHSTSRLAAKLAVGLRLLTALFQAQHLQWSSFEPSLCPRSVAVYAELKQLGSVGEPGGVYKAEQLEVCY